jgi:hypothetical protein
MPNFDDSILVRPFHLDAFAQSIGLRPWTLDATWSHWNGACAFLGHVGPGLLLTYKYLYEDQRAVVPYPQTFDEAFNALVGHNWLAPQDRHVVLRAYETAYRADC